MYFNGIWVSADLINETKAKEELITELEALKKKNEELSTCNKDLRTDNDVLRATKLKNEEKIDASTKEIEIHEQTISDLTKDCQEMKQKNLELQSKVDGTYNIRYS